MSLTGKMFICLVLVVLTLSACTSQAEKSLSTTKKIFEQIPAPSDAQTLYLDKEENNDPTYYYLYYGFWGLYGINADRFFVENYYREVLTKQGWTEFDQTHASEPMFCNPDHQFIRIVIENVAAHLHRPAVPADILAKAEADYQTLFSVNVRYSPDLLPDCKGRMIP